MDLILTIIMIFAFICGLITFVNYSSHPLAYTGLIKYTGGKFWVFAFICFALKYVTHY